MDFNIDDYDVDDIIEYFNGMKKDQEQYYGTAMTIGLDFAMVDLINVGSELDVTGLSDYEVIMKAYNMGILENFRKGRRY